MSAKFNEGRLAQVLQFTLPGSPNLWQGSEIDTLGDGYPEQRAPMRWDVVEAGHPSRTDQSSMASSGGSAAVLRGGTFRRNTGAGTQSTGGSGDGARPGSGRALP